MQKGFVWPSGVVFSENRDFSHFSIHLFFPSPLPFFCLLSQLLSCRPSLPILRDVAVESTLAAFFSFNLCCRRVLPSAWLQQYDLIVTNVGVIVHSIVEIPILLVDKLVGLFHQKAVCRHRFGGRRPLSDA